MGLALLESARATSWPRRSHGTRLVELRQDCSHEPQGVQSRGSSGFGKSGSSKLEVGSVVTRSKTAVRDARELQLQRRLRHHLIDVSGPLGARPRSQGLGLRVQTLLTPDFFP